MINKMAWGKKYGLMVLNTRDLICKGKSMERASFYGLMDQYMKENSKIIIYKDKEPICGRMEEGM